MEHCNNKALISDHHAGFSKERQRADHGKHFVIAGNHFAGHGEHFAIAGELIELFFLPYSAIE